MKPDIRDVKIPIFSPRLSFRPALPGDGQLIRHAKTESWISLKKYLFAGEPPSLADEEDAVIKLLSAFVLGNEYHFLGFITETGQFALSISLKLRSEHLPSYGFFYWASDHYVGIGLMTEAVIALSHYAFKVLGARRLSTGHAASNLASAKVAIKAGFSLEAETSLGYALPDGSFVTGVAYGMTDITQVPSLEVTWADSSFESVLRGGLKG